VKLNDESALPAEPRPEPPPPRRHPSTIGGGLYIVVVVAMCTGLAMIWSTGDWRFGIRVVAGALATAAVLRLILPERDAGMLAVRHRITDVTIVGSIAIALFILASSIPDQPL
jgi:hypothetical protein